MSRYLGRNLLRMRTHEFTCARTCLMQMSFSAASRFLFLSRKRRRRRETPRANRAWRSLKLLVLRNSSGVPISSAREPSRGRHVARIFYLYQRERLGARLHNGPRPRVPRSLLLHGLAAWSITLIRPGERSRVSRYLI